MQKLIKLSETHYIVVDDSEIKGGDWGINKLNEIIHFSTVYGIDDYCKKITHSTQPLENNDYVVCNNCDWEGYEEDLKIFTDLSDDNISHDVQYFKGCPSCETDDYLMDKQKVMLISLSEVEEAINGYSVITLANEHQKIQQETEWNIEITPEGKIVLL